MPDIVQSGRCYTLIVLIVPPPNISLPEHTSSAFPLDDGGLVRAISFTATAVLNETTIGCRATKEDLTEVSPPALLLVQGKGVLRKNVH